MNAGDNTDTSLYNEGLLQIQRLHNLWTQANYQSKLGKYRDWHWTLDNIWRELTRDAIKKEKKDVKPEDFKDLEEKNPWFKEYGVLTTRLYDAAMKDAILKSRKKRLHVEVGLHQYAILCKMEIFLRSLQDVVGKGGKYKSEDDDGMD